MKASTSMPKLPEATREQLTCKVATTEAWQKGEESVTNGNRILYHTILKSLKDGKGCLIGRHGTLELTTLLQTIQNPHLIDSQRTALLELHAGVFPRTNEAIADWIVNYWEASEAADVMAAAWYKPLAVAEWSYLDKYNPKATRIPLRSLEPYYCKPVDRWTRALEGQRVCVVSSFVETMDQQLAIAGSIWQEDRDTLLPQGITWSFVRSYYSPALAQGRCEWPEGIKSWSDAVEDLEKQVLATGAKIVLVGCGGLAMPLAHRLKKKGIVAIVLGGAIQVLFGIKGKRWETHDSISKFWNAAWVWPSSNETPVGAVKVEGGCYW
jgi:hypothetical protein